MLFLGIDLGTSSVKLLLSDERGTILRSASKDYPLLFPAPGWSEQRPEDWWDGVCAGLDELLAGIPREEVRGIACGGQMHGLVVLDEADRVLRPAILWNDSRTAEEVAYLNGVIGCERLTEWTANIAFAGFTAPKLLWMRTHEPELFARIRRIMLPKDYINYRLTGVHACDYSDASGMLLLDVRNRTWSREMLELCGIREEQLPRLFESFEPIGTLTPEMARRFGLRGDVLVAAGAGDNAAAAVGTGTVDDGACNISLGTSGTVFIASDRFVVDPNNALHAFAHASGGYHLMGCMLSAASCNAWLCKSILRSDDYCREEQEEITDERLGRCPVFFLPYLMGERSPINDVDARGCFVGLSLDSGRNELLQAVLEGVAFAIRDSVEVARGQGLRIERSGICGGGGKMPLWRKIMANVLGMELVSPAVEEGPGYGAVMLAMVACGLYGSVSECTRALCAEGSVTRPDPEIAARYDLAYARFKTLYPALKPVFKGLKY